MTALARPGAPPRLFVASGRGRRLALFPGAFRPPHAAHLRAVLDLLARPQVDEVVVIVSGRSRPVPGTAQVLDAEVARQVWSIYLQDRPNVRVEIAAHSAVRHALSYIERAAAGDTLWFCLGEADLAAGADRFRALPALAAAAGITAEVVAAPTASLAVRATSLRAALARGRAGYATFVAALPGALTHAQRDRVWAVCRRGLRDAATVIERRLRQQLARSDLDLGEVLELRVARPDKPDPVYFARFAGGRRGYLKYAGDTVADVLDAGQAATAKPRRRLAAERRALEYLRANPAGGLYPPEVIYFDKTTRTLLLSEAGPGGGASLQHQLSRGNFDPQLAAAIGRFLGACHTPAGSVRALWGDAEDDLRQWRYLLARRTVGLAVHRCGRLRGELAALRSASERAAARYRGSGLFHLDVCPKNILHGDGRPGIIDFESSTNVGDPALELGWLLGHYLYWGLATAAAGDCDRALTAALDAYRQVATARWPNVAARVAAFAGAGLLACIADAAPDAKRPRRLAAAAGLLAQRYRGADQIAPALRRALGDARC